MSAHTLWFLKNKNNFFSYCEQLSNKDDYQQILAAHILYEKHGTINYVYIEVKLKIRFLTLWGSSARCNKSIRMSPTITTNHKQNLLGYDFRRDIMMIFICFNISNGYKVLSWEVINKHITNLTIVTKNLWKNREFSKIGKEWLIFSFNGN